MGVRDPTSKHFYSLVVIGLVELVKGHPVRKIPRTTKDSYLMPFFLPFPRQFIRPVITKTPRGTEMLVQVQNTKGISPLSPIFILCVGFVGQMTGKLVSLVG
jgi:hypothetical protein